MIKSDRSIVLKWLKSISEKNFAMDKSYYTQAAWII